MLSQDGMTGLQLSRRFYFEEVKLIIDRHFPQLRYSAALIGHGSEVLGFDDEMSRDHHWGPRLMLFLNQEQHRTLCAELDACLRKNLAPVYLGFSTNFSSPDECGVRLMVPGESGSIDHIVEILTVEGYFSRLLGIDIQKPIGVMDWISFPQQLLLATQVGAVFFDEVGLGEARLKIRYFPESVWRYIIASVWQRIGQEEHLAPRAGITGQETGSKIIAARLVRDIMQLVFLYEKKYFPYSKWFERAFLKLNHAGLYQPVLSKILGESSWKRRQSALCDAFELLCKLHNGLNITCPIPEKRREWHGRSFDAIQGEEITELIIDSISAKEFPDKLLRNPVGAIDQISDNTDVLECVNIRRAIIHSLV